MVSGLTKGWKEKNGLVEKGVFQRGSSLILIKWNLLVGSWVLKTEGHCRARECWFLYSLWPCF